MSLEDLFTKKYVELEEKNIELEKKQKHTEIELNQAKQLLKDVTEFIQNGEPKITGQGQLYLSYFLYDKEKDRAVELLKKLGIKIKEQEQ